MRIASMSSFACWKCAISSNLAVSVVIVKTISSLSLAKLSSNVSNKAIASSRVSSKDSVAIRRRISARIC